MTPPNYSSDTKLFQQIAEGDEHAFETFYCSYLPRMKAFINGIIKVEAITDELLQELFLKVWVGRAHLIQVSNPAAWVYKIAANLAIDQLRKQATEYKAIKAALAEKNEMADDLFEQLTAKQLQQIVHEVVENLPNQRKKIYLLTRESGWSHKEVADYLGISVQTVKNQIVSALKTIQQHIHKSTLS